MTEGKGACDLNAEGPKVDSENTSAWEDATLAVDNGACDLLTLTGRSESRNVEQPASEKALDGVPASSGATEGSRAEMGPWDAHRESVSSPVS
jgi:hypothetical protein